MAQNSGQEFVLPLVADLFSSEESRQDARLEKVTEIPLRDISDFPDHPFRVTDNEEMQEIAESIKQSGILVPALVRTRPEGGYEMIAGHRRKRACELAGIENIPCIVRNLSNDEAILAMVNSNLQRENILPSEKAFAYKMKLEAMKRQAGRPSKNSVPVAQNFEGKPSRQLLGEEVGESQDQIRRYIRLTNLISPILQMVDNGQMAFRPAVEISYLPEQEQQSLMETMECEESTPSLAQAQKMKQFSAAGKLNEDVILSIISEQKPNQPEKIQLKDDRFQKYFPKSFTTQQKEKLLADLLEKWYRNRLRDAR